jgi:hypothetical protein
MKRFASKPYFLPVGQMDFVALVALTDSFISYAPASCHYMNVDRAMFKLP